MTKLQFILSLHKKLSAYPKNEVEERLRFYSEMIEDRIEEGLSEEEAVAAAGSVEQIAAQIAADLSPAEPPKQKRHIKTWEILLLVLGSPVWLSLLLAALAVILSIYVSAGSILISLWAVFASLIGCAIGSTVLGIGLVLSGIAIPGIAVIGAGIFSAGLAVFLFFGCKYLTKTFVVLTKNAGLWIKNRFLKKEDI